LSMSGPQELVLHDLQSGTISRRLSVGSDIHCFVVDATEPHVAICHNFDVSLLRVSDFELVRTPIRHSNRIVDCAFSDDGRRLLTAGIDGESRLWSVPDGLNLNADVTHQREAVAAAFSPDGETFATGQNDGLVRTWRLPLGLSGQVATVGTSEYFSVSPNGEFVASAGFHLHRHKRNIVVHNTKTAQRAGAEISVQGFVNDTAFSSDSKLLAVLLSAPKGGTSEGWSVFRKTMPTEPGYVSVYRWQDNQQLFDAVKTPSEPINAVFSADGKSLVVVCAAGEGFILNPQTGQTLATFQEAGTFTVSLNLTKRIVFAPDGETFATFGYGQGAHLRDSKTGKVLHTIADHSLSSVEYSPDGRLLATASRDCHAGIYSTESGHLVIERPLEHADWVFRCRFSPDGNYLLTACRDHYARLWDWKNNNLVASMPHDEKVFDAAFHPSQPYAVTAGRDQTMRIWHVPSGQPLAPPQKSACKLHQVSITPAGNTAIWHDS
jgi:WD40 repeat protein